MLNFGCIHVRRRVQPKVRPVWHIATNTRQLPIVNDEFNSTQDQVYSWLSVLVAFETSRRAATRLREGALVVWRWPSGATSRLRRTPSPQNLG
jgi:hypothetical protein